MADLHEAHRPVVAADPRVFRAGDGDPVAGVFMASGHRVKADLVAFGVADVGEEADALRKRKLRRDDLATGAFDTARAASMLGMQSR